MKFNIEVDTETLDYDEGITGRIADMVVERVVREYLSRHRSKIMSSITTESIINYTIQKITNDIADETRVERSK